MRWLCLHGAGTNSRIFASQTAAIRHSLDPSNTYEWLDGSLSTDMAAGMEDMVSPGDEFLQYVVETRESREKALNDFEQYIDEEGPFDGLMGFSQGASCGATYLIHQIQQGVQPAFRCAVFFCAAPARDLVTGAESNLKEEIITIPTAHIWGDNDDMGDKFGPALSRLCHSKVREIYIHDGGHEIPGARDPVRLARAVQAIRRTIARAQSAK